MDTFLSNLVANQKAIMVGLALAATCSLLSVFIVLRRMAMIAEAVAHSGIGGIAIALLLGYYYPLFNNPVAIELVTGVFCVVTALLIGYITKGGHVSEDSAIGIFLVVTLALGVLLLSIRSKLPVLPDRPRAASVEMILFGDIISVTSVEVWIALGAMILIFAIVLAFYNEFVYTALDQEMARINGVNTRLINFLQLSMISLIIVVGVRMVGGLMITAFTVLPGATACMLSRRFNGVLIASMLVGFFGVGFGLVIALEPPMWRYTSGPVLVLTLFLIFLVVWLVKRFFKPKVAETAEASAEATSAPVHAGHSHSH